MLDDTLDLAERQPSTAALLPALADQPHLVLPEGVREKPIPFRGQMVTAVRLELKHQTRRLVRPFGNDRAFVLVAGDQDVGRWPWRSEDGLTTNVRRGDPRPLDCPYGTAGDRLWVKETMCDLRNSGIEARTGSTARCAYRADTPEGSYGDARRLELGLKWRSSMYMPRWASRVDLHVRRVWVEFLHDISEEDALEEGIVELRGGGFGLADGSHYHGSDPRVSYWSLFEEIHSREVVERNPLLWCVDFRKLRG